MNRQGFSGQVYYQQDYNILNHFHWIDTDSSDPNSFRRMQSPNFPLRTERTKEMHQNLNNFILKIDEHYKKLLTRLKITSNIMFVGKLK